MRLAFLFLAWSASASERAERPAFQFLRQREDWSGFELYALGLERDIPVTFNGTMGAETRDDMTFGYVQLEFRF